MNIEHFCLKYTLQISNSCQMNIIVLLILNSYLFLKFWILYGKNIKLALL